jgi:hypothetical protein
MRLGPAVIGSDDDVRIQLCRHGLPITAPDRVEHLPVDIDTF